MLYYKCPTCSTLFANKQLIWETEKEKICLNSSLSNEQKDKEKRKLLDKLYITRYCCRMRFLGYTDEVNFIK